MGGFDAAAVRLPLSGWTLRTARGPGRRPALEVYSPSGFVDVSVPTALGSGILRGARRGRREGRRWSLAWGHLPGNPPAGGMPAGGMPAGEPSAPEPRVVFRRWRYEQWIEPILIQGRFWVAEVEGGFRSVGISTGSALAKARLAAT